MGKLKRYLRKWQDYEFNLITEKLLHFKQNLMVDISRYALK
jgi:hypothetical protein